MSNKSILQTNNEVLSSNNLDLQSLIDQANALPDAGGVELPELENEGTAEDLVKGKQLINSSGEIVEGTVGEVAAKSELRMTLGTPIKTQNWDKKDIIGVTAKSPVNVLIRENATIGIYSEPSNFGDAAAADVISGKTFTSEAGVKVTGTFTIDNELTTQDNLIAQIQAAVDGLPEAGSGNIETCIGTIDIDIVGTLFTDEPEIYFLNKDLTLQHLTISFMDAGKEIEVVKNSIIYIKYVYPSGDENVVVLEGNLDNIKACYALNDFTVLFST